MGDIASFRGKILIPSGLENFEKGYSIGMSDGIYYCSAKILFNDDKEKIYSFDVSGKRKPSQIEDGIKKYFVLSSLTSNF